MIRVNLEKNIVEMGGNTLDHINEVMLAAWEAANECPQLKGKMKKMFNKVLDEKERPMLQSEKEFTNSTRELLGITSEPEEPAPLDLEDVEHLLHKAEKAEDKGNFISVSWSGAYAGVEVAIMHGNFNASKRIDASFSFRLHSTGYSAQKYREEYNNCIAYLEKLVGEEDDN